MPPSPLTRRQALGAAALCVIPMSGCQGLTSETETTPTSTGTPPTPSELNRDEFPDWPHPRKTRFSDLRIGSEPDLPRDTVPHEYGVGNMDSAERSITITVWRGNTVVLDRSIEFPPYGVLWLKTYEPGEYTVVVTPANGSRFVTHPSGLDCNTHTWEIAVFPDGEIASQAYRTALAC